MSEPKRRRLNGKEDTSTASEIRQNERSPKSIIIDPHGDLMILLPDYTLPEVERSAIKNSGCPHPELQVLVSSKVLTLVSEKLRKIATEGPFELPAAPRIAQEEASGRPSHEPHPLKIKQEETIEEQILKASTSPAAGINIYRMPDLEAKDSPAFINVLLAAHMRFDRLPTIMVPSELCRLAAVCKRFGTMPLMRSHIPRWTNALGPGVTGEDRIGRMGIACAFGHKQEFLRQVNPIIENCAVPLGRQGELIYGSCNVRIHCSPEIFEYIKEARELKLKRMMDACSGVYLQLLLDTDDECTINQFGYFVKQLLNTGIPHPRIPISRAEIDSITTSAQVILGKLVQLGTTLGNRHVQSKCTCRRRNWTGFCESVKAAANVSLLLPDAMIVRFENPLQNQTA